MNDASAIKAFRDSMFKPELLKFDPEHGVFLVPEGFKAVDARPFLPPPESIKAAIEVDTVGSFIDYVSAFSPTATIFAAPHANTWRAVLDYHAATSRGKCEHIVVLQLKYSFEGKLWLDAHGKRMTHEEFVRFLEDRGKEITSMQTAQLYEIVRSLNIRNDAEFSSEVSLHDNAVRLSYAETIRGANKPGQIEIPREFVVTLPLFEGMPARELPARLRYQVKDQKLTLWFEFIDKDRLVKAAVDDISLYLDSHLIEARFYSGSLK